MKKYNFPLSNLISSFNYLEKEKLKLLQSEYVRGSTVKRLFSNNRFFYCLFKFPNRIADIKVKDLYKFRDEVIENIKS